MARSVPEAVQMISLYISLAKILSHAHARMNQLAGIWNYHNWLGLIKLHPWSWGGSQILLMLNIPGQSMNKISECLHVAPNQHYLSWFLMLSLCSAHAFLLFYFCYILKILTYLFYFPPPQVCSMSLKSSH